MANRHSAVEGLVLKHLFQGAYAGTRVLVTGHTGFKGSWLCLWLQALGAEVSALALPPEGEIAHWPLLHLEGVRERLIDLRDAAGVRATLKELQPQIVFHLAAQSLVRRSYHEPSQTFAINVTGLVNLLEAVREFTSVCALVNATTDKVYREPPPVDGYGEDHPLGGHDPYSTSKACAELVMDSYRKSYFSGAGRPTPLLATARAGNVIGGGDWADERLVPDLVRAAMADTPLRLRNPDAVRPWQHVLESLSGYLHLGQRLLAGESVEGAWNFGPTNAATLSVRDMVKAIQRHWSGIAVETVPGPHPHEAAMLTLDCSKAALQLDWHPVWDAETTIRHTIDWYRAFHLHGEVRSHVDLHAYVDAARAAGCQWARPA